MEKTKEFRLRFTEQAQKIVEKLTLEEKISLMSGNITFQEEMDKFKSDPDNLHYNHVPYSAGGLKAYNIPPLLFCDGPRGVVCGNKKSTCFPVTMLRGASFDDALERKIGHAIGKEIKAYDGNYFGGVCINLPYNPGWGRSQETYGEESFHLGKMGAALMEGVQEEDIIACIKHYAFNQMENARFEVSIECDKRTEREVFLPHFKECIDRGAGSVMSSYNKYQGTYCGHHDYLLNQVLKDEWGFDGFVVSDFYWGVKDTVEAANGGQNIEMAHTKFFGENLMNAVNAGKVPKTKINDAALRIVRTLLAFEADRKDEDESVLACNEHIELALESARKGITLLQNNNKVLPLDRAKINKVLVLGKLAKAEVIGDHGSSWVRPPYVISPFEGIKKIAGDSVNVLYATGEDKEEAKRLAQEADAVVFVVGYNHDDEGEYVSFDEAEGYTGSMGGDRKNGLGLHQEDVQLINEVGPVNAKSIVTLVGGNMIMMTEWYQSVNSILMAYYSGMEGGRALAEIIFGDVNPSGKLPYVLPVDEKDLPQVDWNASVQHYDYYHGYAKLDKESKEPLLPYGFGLSYTTFEIKDVKFTQDGEKLTGTCIVTNTGNCEGDEVVQLYVGFNNSSIDRPVKLLRGFERANLKPGESKIVTIDCPINKLAYYDEETNTMRIEAMTYEVYMGASSKDLTQHTIEIKG